MMHARIDDIASFKAWLIKRGAVIEAPTNEWEILRIRTCEGTHVAYRNARGAETWPEPLQRFREAFRAGRDIALSPDNTARHRLRDRIQRLSARDGLWCWFCQAGFLSEDSTEVTIEHLVPKAHGGPDHDSNLVLACKPCNQEAGHLPVAEKVALRDRKLGRTA